MTTQAPALDRRAWKGSIIQQRTSDGFVNATAICQATGKRWNHYIANQRTQDYIAALAAEIYGGAAVAGNPATGNSGIEDLIQVRQGGEPSLQGTWVHPRLAIDLARWVSPEFAVWMDGWFLDWVQGKASPQPIVKQRPQPQVPEAPMDAWPPAWVNAQRHAQTRLGIENNIWSRFHEAPVIRYADANEMTRLSILLSMLVEDHQQGLVDDETEAVISTVALAIHHRYKRPARYVPQRPTQSFVQRVCLEQLHAIATASLPAELPAAPSHRRRRPRG